MLIFRQIREAYSHIGAPDVDREKYYFKEMKAVGDADPTGQVYRHFDVLSGRTSSLLSHISIMIAVTAFMLSMAYPKGTSMDIFGVFLTIELAAYSALTIPVLSITFVTNSMTSSRYGERPKLSEANMVLDKYLMVFHTRRAYFYISFIALTVLNTLFVLTVSAKFLTRIF